MDSRIRPSPIAIIIMFLYLPSNDSPGSNVIAKKLTQTGIKQTMKSAEIRTTILVTFLSRMEALLACDTLVDVFRHFVFLWSLTTRVNVQMMMMVKALKGTNTLFTANDTFSTVSLFSV